MPGVPLGLQPPCSAATPSFGQRAGGVKRFCLAPRRAHPNLAFFLRRQKNGHGLRMDGLYDLVGVGRQEGLEVVFSLARLGVSVAIRNAD